MAQVSGNQVHCLLHLPSFVHGEAYSHETMLGNPFFSLLSFPGIPYQPTVGILLSRYIVEAHHASNDSMAAPDILVAWVGFLVPAGLPRSPILLQNHTKDVRFQTSLTDERQNGLPPAMSNSFPHLALRLAPELICRQFDNPSEHYPVLTASNVANVSERSFLLYIHGLDDGDTRNSVVSPTTWGSVQPLCLCFGQKVKTRHINTQLVCVSFTTFCSPIIITLW